MVTPIIIVRKLRKIQEENSRSQLMKLSCINIDKHHGNSKLRKQQISCVKLTYIKKCFQILHQFLVAYSSVTLHLSFFSIFKCVCGCAELLRLLT